MSGLNSIKITVHTDRPNEAYHWIIIDKLKKRNLYSEDGEIVFNIDSIHNSGFRKGKKLTIYWEIEDYRYQGMNKQYYEDSDILYIGHKAHKEFYPSKSKVMYLACDPERHKEVKADKLYDIVFVGTVEFLPTYIDRITILHDLQLRRLNMAILYGKQSEYMKHLCSGRLALNVLPRTVNDKVQINAKVYEIMATTCLVQNYNPILDELFAPNVHYVPLEKIEIVTNAEIERIKKTSRQYMIDSHTWDHRIDQLVKDIYEYSNHRS